MAGSSSSFSAANLTVRVGLRQMKLILATALSWLAFFNGLMVLNAPIFVVACSKCDMFESKTLYYRFTNGYFDLLSILPGEGLWLFLGFSPVVWLLLFFWTGNLRILPWMHVAFAKDDL